MCLAFDVYDLILPFQGGCNDFETMSGWVPCRRGEVAGRMGLDLA